jgi:alanine dehydrogenase
MRRTGPNVTALYPYTDSVSRAVAQADLFVGAVLIPGAKAPRLISVAQVASMEPGSVIVDISVDQGGCVETTHPTTYEAPTYKAHDVIHFAVTNMPGAVPRSASRSLCASLFPWVARLATPRWRDDPSLAAAVNVCAGEVVHPALAGP